MQLLIIKNHSGLKKNLTWTHSSTQSPGEIAGEALEEVSGKGAVTARYLVDKAATEDDIQRLLDAV